MKRIPPPPLRGEALSGSFVAKDGDGLPVDPIEAIFPILRQLDSGQWKLIGTGFFITINGIFVTAKHVLLDVLDRGGRQTYPIAHCQFLPNNRYLLRPIGRCTTNDSADIGVGVASQMIHNITGEKLSNKILMLTTEAPEIHEVVCTYAYPKTIINFDPPNQELHFYPTFYDGEVQEYYPNGRDRVLLPTPCYRTSMVIHGGASGGPVFGPSGNVFGVNNTGIDGSDAISFVSRINEILPLGVTGVVLPGDNNGEVVKIQELAKMGFIVFNPPLH